MNYLSGKLTRRVPLLSLLLSAVFPWLIINNGGHVPYLGFALVLSALATGVFLIKPEKKNYQTLLFGSVLLFSAFLVIRAAEFLFFHNVLTILYIGSLLVMPVGEKTSLIHILFTPVIVFLNTIRQVNTYPYNINTTLDKKVAGKNIQEHIPAIIITGIILLIVVPLLSSANPFFNKLVNDALEILSIDWLLDKFKPHEIFLLGVRIILFLFFLFFIPRLLSLSASETNLGEEVKLLPINYLIPKVVMTILLLIFFMTQAQLYFAGAETLRAIGYTNSQQTREVFAQLSIVAIVVFFLVYIDRAKGELAKVLTYVLIIEAFFLCGIALKSVYDYTTNWGFTHKRLYGYADVVWVTGIFLIFLYRFMKRTKHLTFIHTIVGFTLTILLCINMVNFDYIIYHFAKSTTHAGTDHVYLSSLSADAHSYKNHLPIVMKKVAETKKGDEPFLSVMPAYSLLYKIEYLQNKYASFPPIGAVNIAEYQEYLSVKEIDTQRYRDQISKKEQELFQSYQQTDTAIPQYPAYSN